MGNVISASAVLEAGEQPVNTELETLLTGTQDNQVELADPYSAELILPQPAEPLTMWRYSALLPPEVGPIRYPPKVGETPVE